ncbi:FAD-dependent oxidoreductase [Actinoallomurus bryophytorum]|uniref:Putative NAD/FAD-binding protein n=1 Tax=Actinoallomurus bryophytorum TaxID=1490222 RepID=A0A543CNX2_9ACTN|nr:FAD-dependent oxidoreductase [Actinoallomurus bryophytorum]TQL98808.1 putative NAD/FAD-binding protein [Actinoallomurus bryophytorum]
MRIAVIGSGVAGLTAAYVLARNSDVTLYEADERLGGHAHTHDVGGLAVDSGFIVHNDTTYPLLTRLFRELGVQTQPSEMSMSIRCHGCGLEYAGGRGPGGLLVRRPGLRYLRMLAEVPRFHRAARAVLDDGAHESPPLGEFLDGYSPYFVAHFATPLVAAVWSCSPADAMRYPARYLFSFLANHGMLSVTGAPQWRTVTEGSRSYVDRIAKELTSVRTGEQVRELRRTPGGVTLRAAGDTEDFDAAVVATHPDQALRVLAEPTPAERDTLGAFRYSRNEAVLHTDGSVLPERARASWNYTMPSCVASADRVKVSYDLNRLQRLETSQPHVVTLGEEIAERHVLARMVYEHPVYTPESVAAQARLPGLDDRRIVFAGAYHGWGFHEDGCRSGVEAARALGGVW